MVLLKHDDFNELEIYNRLDKFEAEWQIISGQVSDAFNWSAEKKEWLRNKKVARLIAAIPYLAGCDIPMQTAASHLATYMLSVSAASKTIFHHQQWIDDTSIMNRLRPIADFIGGDERIIDRGMNLLALNMICGYERDVEKDLNNGKYNPVESGSWDFEKLKKEYIDRISSVGLPQMDEIMNVGDGTDEFWGM